MSKDNTYKGIYAMHKYWGKKPFHEISRFIEKYSEPGEVVLDSFCGSGITLIEAAKLKRKCVGVDLNPIAIKIAEVSLTAVDIEELHKAFDRIKEKLKSVIYSMYTVEERKKNSENYNTLLDQAFSEIHRVLKPDRYFSLAFNCLKDDIWLDILNLFVRYGFEISDIVPLEYSATSVVQDNWKNALKTDFVLTFRNTDHGQQKIIFKEDKEILKNKIEEIFHKNPNSQTYYIINKLFEETIPQGYIFRVSDIVKQCAAREDH